VCVAVPNARKHGAERYVRSVGVMRVLVNEGGKEVEVVGKEGRWNNMGYANRKPIRS
jgi:hypothetical protein